MVLIGCGTFDTHARGQMTAILRDRMSEELRRRMDHLEEEFPEPNKRLRALGELTLPLYSYDPDIAEFEPESDASDARAKNDETWQDMVRLQNEGVYPAAFAAIETPVLMLHGAADPHPGRLIRASLEPYLPQLEYCELERCGHYPWLERQARDQFFSVLRDWLARH
jgi:pimeloyl-ACP methyl ester carboxylesterase